MKILKFMLLFVPISFIGKFLNFSPTIMFILAALSIIPLAGIMGEGTEEISSYTGPKIGGFLNATFGNATELIISFFALKSGLFEVVKSSIAGSIIGNILLVLGASMFIGGLKHKTQNFNINVVETTSSMLLFSLIGLCVPAFFTHTINPNLLNTRYEGLSLVVAIVMFILYDRRRRLAYIIICGCFLFGMLVCLPEITSFLNYTIQRLFRVLNQFLMGGADTETRVRHYARGIEDFLNHPILGTGLGNMTNRDIFKNKPGSLCWYHCEPIQIAGSFGIVGIVAFVYQFIKRNVLIWKKATLFNMTIFLSYISLELMSLVNPGIFCPVPYLLLVVIYMIVIEKCNDNEPQIKVSIFKKFKNRNKLKGSN